MSEYVILDDDIIRIYKLGARKSVKNLVATLFWGDRIRVVGKKGKDSIVEIPRRKWNESKNRYDTYIEKGILPGKARLRNKYILKVRFLDVGQGDAAIVETPRNRIILIDGGEEEHLRRYINGAYSHFLRNGPLHCEAVVVTHGDADHFSGLTKLFNAWRKSGSPMITASRVFHNGLVKRTYRKSIEAFGRTRKEGGVTYVVDLYDDIRKVPDNKMNTPFRAYKTALSKLKDKKKGKRPKVQRLGYANDTAFDFLHEEGIFMEVLGPIVDHIGSTPGLRFLKQPGGNSLSASHTVNGHSVVLRMRYGNVHFLFGADLNEESEERLLERVRTQSRSLISEILKVPHHGSADFSPHMLEAIRPVASVVSSGDESISKEYIHPRAGLVGALGKFSRESVDKPLLYVTEMVAFFQKLGKVDVQRYNKRSGKVSKKTETIVNAYKKLIFGIVHVRTDGQRVLVATHSARDDQKESYVFYVDESGDICFAEKPRII
jgi:beta-lactamase superfamily II metal-dependent hydrolase